MNDYYKEVEQAKERWADEWEMPIVEAERRWANDQIEINAAREQKAYNEGYANGKAEAERRKHGKPIVYYHGENAFSYECGVCRMPIDGKDYYCRWCGAKIDNAERTYKNE
jgi:hypothetical protein